VRWGGVWWLLGWCVSSGARGGAWIRGPVLGGLGFRGTVLLDVGGAWGCCGVCLVVGGKRASWQWELDGRGGVAVGGVQVLAVAW